jgi:hypothetical protein
MEAEITPVACAICDTRKEKRFCPAVHGRICPVCCGREREVTLDCPSTCVYLQQARQYEQPRGIEDIPAESLFPQVEVSESFLREQAQLLTGFWVAILRRFHADRSLNDREVVGALRSMAKSYETRVNSGLHYEPPSASVPQQALIDEINQLLNEYREAEQKHVGYSRLRDSEVFRVLAFMLRVAEMRTSGRPRSRAFLDWLAAELPEEKGIAAPGESRLIVP